jgi:antitoxin ParD1/3/4
MTIALSLPESLEAFVQEQTARGGFESPSDYVRTVLAEAQRRALREELENKLMEGLQGPYREFKPEDWAAKRQKILDQHPELRES